MVAHLVVQYEIYPLSFSIDLRCQSSIYVIVTSHHEYEYEAKPRMSVNNNDTLRVQWDITYLYSKGLYQSASWLYIICPPMNFIFLSLRILGRFRPVNGMATWDCYAAMEAWMLSSKLQLSFTSLKLFYLNQFVIYSSYVDTENDNCT